MHQKAHIFVKMMRLTFQIWVFFGPSECICATLTEDNWPLYSYAGVTKKHLLHGDDSLVGQ